MDVLLQAIGPFIALLVVLIFVHELGHFVTAKMAGVKVLEFGFGYPPRVFGIKWGETEYTVNALPLGGFVKLLGEEDPGDPQSLAAKPRWVRLVVLGSGAVMNVLLAILLFALALMIPRDVDISRAVIADVVPESPAAEAGLKEGDVIFAVDGHDVQSVSELSYRSRLNLGNTVDLRIKRAGAFGSDGSDFIEVPVKLRWSTSSYTYESSLAEGSSIDAAALPTDENPIALEVTSTEGFGGNGVLTLDPGTPNEEHLEYWVDSGNTILITDRALGDTTARAHEGGAPIENEVPQGPMGIRIAPAYGAIETISLEDQAEIAEDLPAGIEPPTTQVRPYSETQWSWPWEAIPDGTVRSWESLILARNEIISRINGGISGSGGGLEVTGPVGIAQLTGEVVDEAGWKSLMEFAALLSMNLAVLNILPLPMLDGGRMVFVLLEIIRRGKRIAPEKEAMVHFVGLVLILSFAAVITYLDVVRIFEGDGILR